MRGLMVVTVWLLVALVAVSALAAYGAAHAAAQAVGRWVPAAAAGGGPAAAAAPAAAVAAAPAATQASAPLEGLHHLATYAGLADHLRSRSGWIEQRVAEMAGVLLREGLRYGVNPWILASVIEVESDFDPAAVGSSGEIGLMQVMPGTARLVARSLGIRDFNPAMLFDPEFNVRIGAAHLGWLLRQHDGDVVAALTAYNAGRATSSVGLRYAYKVLGVMDGIGADVRVAARMPLDR